MKNFQFLVYWYTRNREVHEKPENLWLFTDLNVTTKVNKEYTREGGGGVKLGLPGSLTLHAPVHQHQRNKQIHNLKNFKS